MRCVALTRICYGDSHWKLAEAHVNLAQGYLQLKGEFLADPGGSLLGLPLSHAKVTHNCLEGIIRLS